MGKIVSNFFISLDGVVEAPDQWHMSYFNDEMGAAVGAGMATNRGFLMGRRLYDEWAAFWPQQSADDEFAKFFNSIPKYVVSNSLEKADWNNTTIISGDVAAQLRELREATDGDLVLSGSATLVRWLLAEGSARRAAPAAASGRRRQGRAAVRGRRRPHAEADQQRGVQHRRAEPRVRPIAP